MKSFDEFFAQATANAPHGYQSRLARDGLPAVVQAPTGAGQDRDRAGLVVAQAAWA